MLLTRASGLWHGHALIINIIITKWTIHNAPCLLTAPRHLIRLMTETYIAQHSQSDTGVGSGGARNAVGEPRGTHGLAHTTQQVVRIMVD